VVSERTSGLLLGRLADEQAGRRLPSVAAGLVRNGGLVWNGGRGRVGGAPPGPNVQYRIGSITKTFVAVCVLRLCDDGAVDLGDPLEVHVPGTGAGEATIAQLLSHSAGLRAETAGPWWERTPGSGLDRLVAGSLVTGGFRFETGRRFHYSNVGYALLGALVSACRAAPWEEVVRAELLEPLGMTRTSTRPVDPAAPGLAVHPWADLVLSEPAHEAGAMAPAGQLWSTVADLARWAAFLAGDGAGLLAPSTMRSMREPRAVNDTVGAGWDSAYGLGLQVWNEGGRRSFGHGGSMPGFRASLEYTEAGDAAVVCANATTGLTGELGADLLAILDAEEPRLAAEWSPSQPPPGAMEIVGPWYWGVSPHVLRVRNGLLELEGCSPADRASRFVPAGDGTWRGLDGYHTGEPLTVVAHRDGSVHIEIGSLAFTRGPYEPGHAVPGGVDPAGWTP
jgi:CubicO group peptidase (beta-lactamase class C family)